MAKLIRAEFIARAVADRMKDKLRGQKEAYWVRSAHIDAERRKKDERMVYRIMGVHGSGRGYTAGGCF